MKSTCFLKRLTAATLMACAGVSAQAQTTVVNIDSNSLFSASATFSAGIYEVFWLGTADSRATYSGYQYNTASTGNFREAFSASFNGTTYTFDKDSSAPGGYESYVDSASALASFQSGPFRVYTSTAPTFDARFPGAFSGSVSRPTFTFASDTTVSFGVPDNQLNDNTGGVSILVTAVPEPSSYALMLGGLALTGFVARRRRRDA